MKNVSIYSYVHVHVKCMHSYIRFIYIFFFFLRNNKEMCDIDILLRCLNIGVHSAVVFKRGDLLQLGYVETPVIFVLVHKNCFR